MTRPLKFIAMFPALLAMGSAGRTESPPPDLEARVADVERAFARSMSERDLEAFVTFLSEETVFLSGADVLRGKQAVADAWAVYFTETEAPFSWAPETVAVLDGGDLAISTGPVWDAAGARIATFTSIWRQEEPGIWRIVFDRGTKHCE